MKANFVKRLCAVVIDAVILSIIFSIVTIGFVDNSSTLDNKIFDFQERVENGELSDEDIMNEYYDLFYEIQKANVSDNIVSVVLYIGYFIIFGFLNKGQTIGKKLVKIKVVNKDGDTPSIWNMIFRNIFIYGLSSMLFSILFVNILNSEMFMYGCYVIVYIEFLVLMISFFMVLYRKDGRGLHDILAGTKVIEEVK